MSIDPFDMSEFEPAPPPFDAPTKHGPPPYMEGLNAPQREAVEAVEGPLLVLAGAGTGKTRVLTTRLAHIMASGLATPGQVLAVTFTNKASKQMQDRVARLIGRPVEGMAIGTFHSVAARILRYHAELVGLKSNYTILDTDDQVRLLKQLVQARNIDVKRWPPRLLASLIDRWKNKALTPDQVPSGESYAFADGKGAALYGEYQARLKVLNACDFGDLLLHNLEIFQKYPDVLARYHARFRYILVDEYQDTNLAQYLWLRLLAQATHNICCVGDDDQSIYGWRGAEVGNILKFEADFPGAKVIRLEQNYRSTSHILGAASGLIAANAGRLGKTLWTDAGSGEPVSITGVWDGHEEARHVGDEIESQQSRGHKLTEIAVLVRAGYQTRAFEERFITLGMPYRVVGGPRFYERKEIRDALAYLRVIAQQDDDLAFERIVNVPKRGLGDTTVQKIHLLARAKGCSMTRAAEEIIASDELRPQARRSLNNLLEDFTRWRQEAGLRSHTELAEIVLEESGYTAMWQADKAPDAPGRLDNLMELVRAMGEFENLEGFLEHIALVMEMEQDGGTDKVSIMTLHGAKGLEFDTVFLPGWEEGIFPSQLTLDESGLKGLEEERRLAYVGLTRARKKAHILFAGTRMIFGKWQSALPSRFIDELPAEHVEQSAAAGLYGAATAFRAASKRRDGSDRDEWDQSAGTDEAEDLGNRTGHMGPGWKRAVRKGFASGRRGPMTIDGSARHVKRKPRPVPVSDFAIGERVFHDKFGYGIVEDVDGDKLEVNFETTGSKKIMDSFVSRPE